MMSKNKKSGAGQEPPASATGPAAAPINDTAKPDQPGQTVPSLEPGASADILAALQASEARYRAVVEDQTEVISRFTADGEFTFVNEVFCRFFGKTAAELIGQTWHPLAVAEDLPDIKAKLQTISPANPVVSIENRVHAGNGRIRWMQFVHRATFDHNDRLVEIQSVGRDITEHKQAEERLRQSEARQALLLRNAPVAIVIHDADGRLLHTNEIAQQLLDLAEEEARGKQLDDEVWQFLREDRTPMPVKEYPVSRVLDQGAPVKNLVLGLRRRVRHELRWVLVNANPLFVDGAIAEIIVSFMDITERKQAEEELITYREHLEELVEERTGELEAEIIERKQAAETAVSAKIFLDLVVDRSPFAMWISDKEGTVIRTNQSLRQTINLTDEAILGQYNVLKDKNLREQGVMPLVQAVFENFEPARFTIPWQASLAGVAAFSGGRDLHIDVSMFPIVNARNELTNVVCQWVDITKQRQTTDALRVSEERFSKVFRSSPVGISITRLDDGKFIDVNDSFLEILGFTREEVTDHTTLELNLWADPDERTKIVRLLKEEGKIYNIELKFRRKSGKVGYSLTSAELLELDGVPCMLNLLNDITDRKLAEEKLLESEERLALVLEGSQLGYWDWNLQTGEVQRNERWAEMLGYTLPEITFNVKQWTDLHHPDDREAAWKSIQDHLDGRTPAHRIEYRMRCKNGEYKWILDQASVVERDADGKPLRMSGTHTDITERKLAEDQLRRQTAILATMLNSPQETVALLDTDGNVLAINQNGAKRFDLSPEEMVGQNIYTLLPEPVSSQRKKLITDVMQTGQSAHFEDGRQNMHFMNSVYAVNEPQSGELLGVVIFALDITNRKLMEEALRQSNLRLEKTLAELRETQEQMLHQERLAAVGQLAGGIAHDFNNIMAIITLYSEITLSSSHLTPPERERMATIHEQAWRASHLVQQILDFSRKAMLQMQPINFLSLLQDQVEMLKRILPEHIRIQLICEPDGEKYMVSADQTRMQQIISNLAINARDAMPHGGKLNIELKQVTIEPGQKTPMPDIEPGAWLQLTIADTGTGIQPEVLPHIFEPFYTTKEPGSGSGLGLAQVYGIVGQHGGHVDVKTEWGQGTTFTIYMPVLTTNPLMPLAPGFTNIPQGHGEFVLVVEDNMALRETLSEILIGLNYRIGEAANGLEALALFAEMGDKIDLVLSDVIMPEMGGKDLFLTLKAMGQSVPVVLLSGHTLDESLDDLKEQGLAAWLTKPPSLESLAKALANALQK